MSENPQYQKNTILKPQIVFSRPVFAQKKPLTISVSKKIFKTAVLRNKVKRIIREAYNLSIRDIKHDTLHPIPFLKIDAKEGVLKMKMTDIQNMISKNISEQLGKIRKNQIQ